MCQKCDDLNAYMTSLNGVTTPVNDVATRLVRELAVAIVDVDAATSSTAPPALDASEEEARRILDVALDQAIPNLKDAHARIKMILVNMALLFKDQSQNTLAMEASLAAMREVIINKPKVTSTLHDLLGIK